MLHRSKPIISRNRLTVPIQVVVWWMISLSSTLVIQLRICILTLMCIFTDSLNVCEGPAMCVHGERSVVMTLKKHCSSPQSQWLLYDSGANITYFLEERERDCCGASERKITSRHAIKMLSQENWFLIGPPKYLPV